MRAFAQSIVETVRHPLVVLDQQMRVRAANAPFHATFGVSEAGADGTPVFDLLTSIDVSPLRRMLDHVVACGSIDAFEFDCDLPGQARRTLVLHARLVHGDEDQTPMILVALEDVTETRQAQAELRRLNAQLEQRVRERTADLEAANRELESFSYSVSHDLRAPLRAIDGFSNELVRAYDAKLDDLGRHYLHRIRAGTQRMGQLIDELLRLARLSREELRRERVDLSALAESVAAELRQGEPERHVTVMIEPGLTAVGDGPTLRILFENLLRNAWKFTSKHPRASIRVGRTDHAGRRALFVRDDGAGFDAAHAGKLFGAFQRLHSEREFPGTGIGLATVQRIVRRHGGQIWAEGKPEQGATFYFTLPLEDAP